MKKFKFISLDQAIYLHELSIKNFGGRSGIRDYGLLNSAINLPQTTFLGKYLYKDIFEMACAYAFHLIKNHPFVDGNKRVGVLGAIIFFEINGYKVNFTNEELVDFGLAIACSKINKTEIVRIFKNKIQN